jgi:hypothetical protein
MRWRDYLRIWPIVVLRTPAMAGSGGPLPYRYVSPLPPSQHPDLAAGK